MLVPFPVIHGLSSFQALFGNKGATDFLEINIQISEVSLPFS